MSDTLVQNQFELYSPLTKNSIDSYIEDDEANDGERILLEGVATTTNRDLQKQIITPEALQDVIDQAPNVNICCDHRCGLFDGVIGSVKEVIPDENSLRIRFLIRKKYTEEIKDMLDTGIKLGLSLGGGIRDIDRSKGLIKSVRLSEISLTAMPANLDTYGTVESKGMTKSTCLSEACYNIMKKNMMEKKIMAEDNTQQENSVQDTEEKEYISNEDAINLFNELFADKEEAIKTDVLNEIKPDIETIVADIINSQETEEEPEEESEEESNDEESVAKSEDTTALLEKYMEEMKKSMNNIITEAITSKMETVFKDIGTSRKPEFHSDEEMQKNNDDHEMKKSFTSKEIAERLAVKNDKEALIKSLRN